MFANQQIMPAVTGYDLDSLHSAQHDRLLVSDVTKDMVKIKHWLKYLLEISDKNASHFLWMTDNR